MGKTAVTLALVATNQPAPNGLATSQQIAARCNQYNKNIDTRQQINADFNMQVATLRETFGLGYGINQDDIDPAIQQQFDAKRSVLLQVKANKLAAIPALPTKKLKIKTTVIMTSVSLIGQWEDEVRKHSPGLVVKTFHKSRKKTNATIDLTKTNDVLGINGVDIILSSATFKWPPLVTSSFEFHRVVQDESHLFLKGPSARIECANLLSSSLRWGVTATPATNSATEITKQISFIAGTNSFYNAGSPFYPLYTAISSFNRQPTEASLNALVDLMKTFMIRHTKSQRINGSEALALPPSTTSTIMLTMTRDEDLAFNQINAKASTFSRHLMGAQRFTAEKQFVPQMAKVLKSVDHRSLSEAVTQKKRHYKPEKLTKIVALRNDLATHRRSEPKLRAVVFTQHLDVHDACVRGLQADGYDVHQFTGSSSSNKRDDAIRSFQNTSNGKAAVFVITLRSGNVGITLTAASRVYLLEPSLDPAVEVQAAGRIHRLGQDKPCHVVRFAFKNSYEANTIGLHKKIVAGKISIVDGFIPHEAMKILSKGIRMSTT